MAQKVKNLPSMWKSWDQSLGWEDSLEKGMATHSSVLAWRIPGTGEPGGLPSMGSHRVRHDWEISLSLFLSCTGEGNGNLVQCSCLENPRDGGAWWAAIYGVAQSRTGLKRLSSSSNSQCSWDFPGGSDGKESACKVGNLGLIPGLGRSPGEENGYPLQNSCLENSMDGGAWQATVHGVAKSWTWQSDFTFTFFKDV